ncbi:serine/threonine-protein kinase [Streptomyces afghaniensis]|uniref:serine/threonine-protein kinase n=1 Tax=Streptomyces afghaniensis TaxID=66865 RepID=UPI00278A61DB|nr:serine/threonine-protein kinase [Streptomyces afghaniensis]MDQ1016880.1 serine/threonine protein kinase [Streptomyces afghaniensis]
MHSASGQQPYTVPVPQGYRVGHWEVREPLGSGAFATVYAGRPTGEADPALPRRAALKFLPTGTRTPRQLRHLRELAEREVELLGRLRAPRLIRMHETLTVDDPDHPELDGATVIVLERAETSLDAVLAHDPTPESGPALLAQICEGLHQLHHAGWIHGDLKPANVLLMKDDSVRLADFSMAAELEGTHAYAPAFATPDYTPPELLWPEVDERGTRIRPTADIWAFGVLAHVVLTGEFPLPGGTTEGRIDAATRYARGTDELRLSPELPEGWREIITDCLARTHAERTTAAALLPRVTKAAGVATPARLPRLRPRFWQRRPVLTATLTLALLITTTSTVSAYRHVTTDDGTPVYAAMPRELAFPTNARGEVVYGYHRCPEDSVCFFSEHNGNGDMCVWQGDDPDWQSGEDTCTWAADAPVRSIFNNIDDSHEESAVAYFRGTDFSPADADRRRLAQRTGCSAVNSMGNLAGTYAPRSHRLIDSCSSFTAVVDVLTPW